MTDPTRVATLVSALKATSFWQISLIAWPLKAMAEDAGGFAVSANRAPETEAKRVDAPSSLM
jgi:hypothetical protein